MVAPTRVCYYLYTLAYVQRVIFELQEHVDAKIINFSKSSLVIHPFLLPAAMDLVGARSINSVLTRSRG